MLPIPLWNLMIPSYHQSNQSDINIAQVTTLIVKSHKDDIIMIVS